MSLRSGTRSLRRSTTSSLCHVQDRISCLEQQCEDLAGRLHVLEELAARLRVVEERDVQSTDDSGVVCGSVATRQRHDASVPHASVEVTDPSQAALPHPSHPGGPAGGTHLVIDAWDERSSSACQSGVLQPSPQSSQPCMSAVPPPRHPPSAQSDDSSGRDPPPTTARLCEVRLAAPSPVCPGQQVSLQSQHTAAVALVPLTARESLDAWSVWPPQPAVLQQPTRAYPDPPQRRVSSTDMSGVLDARQVAFLELSLDLLPMWDTMLGSARFGRGIIKSWSHSGATSTYLDVGNWAMAMTLDLCHSIRRSLGVPELYELTSRNQANASDQLEAIMGLRLLDERWREWGDVVDLCSTETFASWNRVPEFTVPQLCAYLRLDALVGQVKESPQLSHVLRGLARAPRGW